MLSTNCLKDRADDVEEEEEDDAVLLDVEEEEATEHSFVALRDILIENEYTIDSRAFIVIPVTSCKNV